VPLVAGTTDPVSSEHAGTGRPSQQRTVPAGSHRWPCTPAGNRLSDTI
jgi:hypothetical protein